MKRVLLVSVAALAALAIAAPIASARLYTVRAGGLVDDNPSGGIARGFGQFRIDLRSGPTRKVTYFDRSTGVSFHSVSLQQLMFTQSAVKIVGVGIANGKRVSFTAIAADHPTGTDAFRISWNHMAAHGGNVLQGNVRVSQISLS